MANKKEARKQAPHEDESSRAQLLRAAKKVFADKGYDGASTRDIANEAGVNISLISYYYGGKEGLYRACLEQISAAGMEMIERILKSVSSIDDFRTRFQIFIEEFIRMQQGDCETMKIVFRDFGDANPIALDVFKTRFLPISDAMTGFFRSAQKQKILSQKIDPEFTTGLVFGCISQMIRSEGTRKAILGRGFLEAARIEKTIAQIVLQFCDGIIQR